MSIALPYEIDVRIPYTGRCVLCGFYDARHRVLDSIAEWRPVNGSQEIADEFGYPIAVVEAVRAHWDPQTGTWIP